MYYVNTPAQPKGTTFIQVSQDNVDSLPMESVWTPAIHLADVIDECNFVTSPQLAAVATDDLLPPILPTAF